MRRSVGVAAALASGLLASSLAAQEGQDTSELEGLLDTSVVSAPSKSAETVNVAPATSISLTAEDMRRHGIRTVDEAINYLAFGMIAEKKFQTAEVGSRGVLITGDFGSHVLLMVDGHVLSEQWGGGAYFDRGTAIPFELIDHIELVLGPGSVLYGSNAMLGIVNIVTKRAKDFDGGHLVVESEVPVSIRGAVGFGKEFELFGSDAELVFEAEHYEQKGPTFDFTAVDVGPDAVTGVRRFYDPLDRRHPPGVYGGEGDDAYYTHAPAAYLKLKVGDLQIAGRAALYQRTYPTDGGNFDDPDSYEQDRFAHIDIKHSVTASAAVKLSTRLYGDLYDYNQYWTSDGAEDCLPGQDSGCLWHLYGSARWVGLEPQLTLDWFEDGRVTTLFGLDARLKQIESDVNYIDNVTGVSPGGIGVYDETEQALAAYLQQTAWPTEWLALNAGARLDVDDRFGNHISPRAAVSLLPWEGGTLKAMYSEAFRAPTAFEIYYRDPDTQLPGGDALEPETVRSVEASIEQRFGANRVLVGVFRSWWDDLVSFTELSATELADAIAAGELSPNASYAYQARNVSSITNYGFNLAWEGSSVAGRLRYGAGYTEAVARREDPGLPEDVLPVAPRAFGNVRVSYDLSSGLPTLAVAGRWVARRPADNYPGIDYADPLYEVRGAVSGPIPPVSGLSYRVTANWLSMEKSAYVLRSALAGTTRERVPTDEFRVGVGLQYDLPL